MVLAATCMADQRTEEQPAKFKTESAKLTTTM